MNGFDTIAPDEPYPGLRSFRRNETHIFFGRETTTNEMVRRLAAYHFLAVTGTSGSGKSSLVRTGLLDALDRGLLAEAGADWRVADFHPGRQPLAALADALLEALGAPSSEQSSLPVQTVLARGPLGLIEWLRGTDLPEHANLLLLVDQFEEIFRYRTEQEADDINAFIALLLASARQRERPVYVVITMRSDFLGECAQFTGLAEAINYGQYLTPRLTREQCQQAIEGPAAVFGGRVAPALVTRLLNDLGSNADQLPLVQHVLMRLWRMALARDGISPELTLQDYEKLGGIGIARPGREGGEDRPANALSAHADEILAELTKDQGRLAAILFRALTESQGSGGRDVRRPITLGEAAAIAGVPPSAMIPVIDAFRGPGRNLLTPPANVPLGPETVVDISHESLIRQWSTLGKWVREEYLAAETYRHVEATAKLWRQGDAALLTMPYLGIALNWREREHPNAFWAKRYGNSFELAMDFLRRSQEAHFQGIAAEERTRRRSTMRARAVAVAMSVLFIIASGFAYFAIEAARRAEENAAAARTSALEAEKSKNIANEMSLRASRERTGAQKGQSIYLAALARQRFLEGDLLQSLLFSTEALPDERRGIKREEVRPAREMLMQGYHQFFAQQSPMTQLSISYFQFLPAGDRLFSTAYDGSARLWDGNGKLLVDLKGHVGAVSGAAVTTDGSLIGTVSYDGAIRIWNAQTGALVNFIGNTGGRLYGISFGRDGKVALTAGPGPIAQVWDAQTGQMLQEFRGHTENLKSAQFNPDGSQVLTVSNDHSARVWDAGSGKLLKIIRFAGSEWILQADYSSDGAYILTKGDEGSIGIWDAKTFTLARRVKAEADLRALAKSRNGALVAIGSAAAEHSVIVLDLNRRSRMFINYSQEIKDLAFNLDGSRLITAGTDTTLRIWDTHTGLQIKRLEIGATANWIAVSNDGERIATISQAGALTVWDVATGRSLGGRPAIRSGSNGLVFDPRGWRFLWTTENGPTTVWDTSTRMLIGTLLSNGAKGSGTFSLDGKWIAAASTTGKVTVWTADELKPVADLETSATTVRLSSHGRFLAASAPLTNLTVFENGNAHSIDAARPVKMKFERTSPDGRKLFTADDRTGCLWDLDSGRLIAQFYEATGNIVDAKFDPQSAHFTTQSSGGTARFMSAETGDELAVLLRDSRGFEFSPLGDRMTTRSQNGRIRVWDTSSGKLLATSQTAGLGFDMSNSADRMVFWSDASIKVMDVTTARQIATIDRDTRGQISAQISDDGSRIAIKNFDEGSVTLWDATTGRQISTLDSTWEIRNIRLEFNRDGTRVLIKDDSGVVELFDGATGARMEQLDNKFRGIAEFTPDGQRVLVAREDGQIALWDAASGTLLAILTEPKMAYRLAFITTKDSKFIIHGGPAPALWDARSGRKITNLRGNSSEVIALRLSSDNSRLLTVGRAGEALLWDVATATTSSKMTLPTGDRDVFFAGNSHRIVSIGKGFQTTVFETATGRRTAARSENTANMSGGFSPDEKHLVSVLAGEMVQISESASGNEVAKLQGHTDKINGVTFSPDGGKILTVSDDRTARLWESPTGRSVVVWQHPGKVSKGQFSPDGTYVVTLSDNGAHRWEVQNDGHGIVLGGGQYDEMAFNPDGSTVLLISFERREMNEFDMKTGQPLAFVTLSPARGELKYYNHPLDNLVVSGDGSMIGSQENDTVWSLPWSLQDYIDKVKALLPRCLTAEERQNAYLDSEPPEWCVEMEKWPYNTAEWKAWLAERSTARQRLAAPQ